MPPPLMRLVAPGAVSGNYQGAVKQFVSNATAADLSMVLDLHWAAGDPGSGRSPDRRSRQL